jgi:snurportin-1
MFSEWLDEIPHDFETNWIMCLCPIGKRCLVVASDVRI